MTNNTPKKDGKVRDIDIRLAFVKKYMSFFEREGMEFASEYGINSTNVVDLAAFDFKSNTFYGIEIKSEVDTTERLHNQLKAYTTFFSIVYVVVHDKLLNEVLEIIDNHDYFKKVGVIAVNSSLEFRGIRKAQPYRPFYPTFISNMDLEELRILSAKYNLPLEGNKNTLLGRLRQHVKTEDIFEGIKNKLYKYRVHKCKVCGSKLYYRRSAGRGGVQYVCFKCGTKMDY